MDFSELGEFGFIDWIRCSYPSSSPSVIKGIGDDAAVLSFSNDLVLLITTDQLIEGFHFRLGETDGEKLGRKALAVNLSDIAAMGGYPIGYTVSLGIPSKRIPFDFVDSFYRGLTALGEMIGVELLGGDTSESGDRLFISITLLGKALKNKVVYRAGGQEGDLIYVSGWLGEAALGFHLLEKGISKKGKENIFFRYLCPIPRVKEGQLLAEKNLPRAMIDISDGLLADLNHLLEQSGLGAEIELSRLPLSPDFQLWTKEYGFDPLSLALEGGEDYELLFCVAPEKSKEVEKLSQEVSLPFTCIGKLIRGTKGIWIKDAKGVIAPVLPKGYNHFKSR